MAILFIKMGLLMSEKQWKEILGWRRGDFVKVLKANQMISGKRRKIYYYGIIHSYDGNSKTYRVEVKMVSGFHRVPFELRPRARDIEIWHPRKPEKWKLSY